MKRFFVFLFLTLLWGSFSEAEVLHNWNEPNPDHPYQNGDIVENLFNTYTSKSATRSESGNSWQLTASATASANAQASSPRSGDLNMQFDAEALVRATGDRHAVEPHTGDGLAKTADGSEIKKTSSDGTTTAMTKRKAHVVLYQNEMSGPATQRFLDVSADGSKSETSVSPSDLDADPWASSWLEVERRTNLNNAVDGSPFESATPKCSSSGKDHTCEGATPPPKKREVVYCRRGDACGNKPGVKGDRDAHKIKCPEQTYKQGIWSWLMLKLKEDCKGEKWSCHSDPDNCSRKHLHLKTEGKSSSGTFVNGIFVPAGYSVGACGEHLYASGSASAHAEKTGACGHTYYACLQGDHDKLQASCSTDTKCISTNFYLCQHTKHEYAKLLRCGHAEGSAGYHLQIGLRCGHKFWYCHGKIDDVLSAHRRFACPVNAEGEKCNVSGGYSHACTPHEHSYPETVSKAPEVPKQKPEVKPDPKPKIVPEEDDEDDDDDDEETPTPVDKDVLGACGIHTYKSSEASSKASLHVEVSFSCGVHKHYKCQEPSSSEKNRHVSQTLSCGNHVGRPCIASSSHSESVSCPDKNGKSCTYGSYYGCSEHVHAYPEPPPPKLQYRPCGHLTTLSGDHSWVASCGVSNSRGDTCTNPVSYYACQVGQIHTHTFPAAPVKTLGPCGVHEITASETSSHSAVSYPCRSHSYYACSTPSSSTLAYHSSRTLPCGNHSGFLCSASGSHRNRVYCPKDSNGKSCSIGFSYLCSPHTHKYPVAPAKRPCGHLLSASGNHSWVSSCGVTNSRGDTCTNSVSYYACKVGQIHTHTFPAAPSKSLGPCGVHEITSSEKRSHSLQSYGCSSHTYYKCSAPSSSERSRHSYGTLACGNHSGYACKASSSHTVSRSCPKDSNGKACLNGPTYYSCSSHSHSYPSAPPPPKKELCPADWLTSCGSSTSHAVECSSGHTYYSCSLPALRHHFQLRQCSRSGCNVSTTNCQNTGGGGCFSGGREYKYHSL